MKKYDKHLQALQTQLLTFEESVDSLKQAYVEKCKFEITKSIKLNIAKLKVANNFDYIANADQILYHDAAVQDLTLIVMEQMTDIVFPDSQQELEFMSSLEYPLLSFKESYGDTTLIEHNTPTLLNRKRFRLFKKR